MKEKEQDSGEEEDLDEAEGTIAPTKNIFKKAILCPSIIDFPKYLLMVASPQLIAKEP